MTEHIPTPEELAYLAGRGSLVFDHEREQAEAAMRIVNATDGPGVHPDPNGAIFGMNHGDRLVFDERGGESTYEYAEED